MVSWLCAGIRFLGRELSTQKLGTQKLGTQKEGA